MKEDEGGDGFSLWHRSPVLYHPLERPERIFGLQVQRSAYGAEHNSLASIPAMPNLVSEAVNPRHLSLVIEQSVGIKGIERAITFQTPTGTAYQNRF